MNLSKSFNSGLGQYMRKATRPSVGLDLSNPRSRRGWRLDHHGGGVCCVFVCCCGWTRDVTSSSYVKWYERITLR